MLQENNLDPKEWTNKNIQTMKDQLENFSIDWEREILMFRRILQHQQIFFLELYEKGLVYRKKTTLTGILSIKQCLRTNKLLMVRWRSGAVVERKIKSMVLIFKFSQEYLMV